MRLHRFFVGQNGFKINTAGVNHLSGAPLSHQLSSVFRFHPGSKAIFFDGSGNDYVSEIVSLEKNETVIRVIDTVAVKQFSDISLSLAFSIIKKDHTEWVVEKCTELGVSRFVPIISERSEKKGIDMARLNKKMIEALEQSGRGDIATIEEISTLFSFIESENKPIVVFHTSANDADGASDAVGATDDGADNTFNKDILNKYLNERKDFTVCIGPEGGWSPDEINLFKQKGALVVKLSTPILRAETASIAVSTLLLSSI